MPAFIHGNRPLGNRPLDNRPLGNRPPGNRPLGSRSLGRDKRGGLAAITAIATIPLLLFTGSAIDFARQVQSYRALANAVDAATLAGATLLSETGAANDITPLVQAYMTAATSSINGTVNTPTVSTTANTVTVTVTASIRTSLLGMIMGSLPTSFTATAGGSNGAFTINATPVATGAADLNSVYIYAVNPNGTKDVSHRRELFDNSGSETYPAGQAVNVTFTLGLGQRLAFELDNLTGGRNPGWYGGQTNTYGSPVGTTNIFYTSDYPASLNTNPTGGYSASNQEWAVNHNHVFFSNSATACYVYQGAAVSLATFNSATGYGTLAGPAQQQNVVVNGSCATTKPASPYNINPTCLELNGQTSGNSMTIDWNDMGAPLSVGDSDIYNADMEYSFSCATSGGAGTYARTVLTN
jgi:Flp pilus assembly protein TadG